jgi:hypothetical protein
MATFEPTFASTHFGAAELGHVQRDRCPVEVAGLIHRHPGGTPPHKPRQPEDDKAMGRPMNRPEVAHAAVLRPHHQRALGLMRQAAGPVLVPHDTTGLDYSGLDSIPELGSIGGDLGHNSLAFDPGRGGGRQTAPNGPGEPAVADGGDGRRPGGAGPRVGARVRPRVGHVRVPGAARGRRHGVRPAVGGPPGPARPNRAGPARCAGTPGRCRRAGASRW